MAFHRIVVKLGTSTLTAGTPHLSMPHMVEIARQLAALRAKGTGVILVTSGAMAAGRERLGFPSAPQRAARQTDARRDRPAAPDGAVRAGLFHVRADPRPGAAHARRPGRPPPLPELAQHPHRAPGSRRHPGHQRKRHRRHRGDPRRRQRQPLGAGGQPDRRRPARSCSPTRSGSTPPIRAPIRMRSWSTR